MKLSEIREQIQKVQAIPINPDGTWDGWDKYPRCNYKDLPASLQKAVREMYSPQSLRRALIDVISDTEFEQAMKQLLSPEQLANFSQRPHENRVSFAVLTADIPDQTLDALLIRARNTAIYTLEPDDEGNPEPELYANHAIAAFDAVLQQYRNPSTADNSRPEDETQIVNILQEIKQPDEITFPKDLVTRKLFNNELTPGETRPVHISQDLVSVVDETGKKIKAHIGAFITVSLLDLPPNVQITRKMNSTDDAVFRAVCSLWARGTTRITGQAIYQTMVGNPNAKATPKWLSDIDESWARLTATQIELDTGTVGDAYNFKRWKRNRRVIEGGKDSITIGNQFGQTTTTVYSILEEPMLHTYGNLLNQITRYSRELLNTPINKTPEVIALQSFLLDHIFAIPHISNHILYDSIWKAMHLQDSTTANDKRKEKLLGHIRKMLEYWKTPCNNGHPLIKRWKEVKQGNTLHHIEITVYPKQEFLTAEQTPEKVGDTPGKNGE